MSEIDADVLTESGTTQTSLFVESGFTTMIKDFINLKNNIKKLAYIFTDNFNFYRIIIEKECITVSISQTRLEITLTNK